MPYSTSLENLLAILHSRAPTLTDAVTAEKRVCHHGLLSIGTKIHCLADNGEFDRLVELIGGPTQALGKNLYRTEKATWCLVLPPVGNADAQILLIRCLEHYTGASIFGNSRYQLQLCSPGRLSTSRCALLATLFYLGSDTIRSYAMADFDTTATRDNTYHRGQRLVIYDAPGPGSQFERDFAWWRTQHNHLKIEQELPFIAGRTDILAGTCSPHDIQTFNLVSTLLTHHELSSYAGYWSRHGARLEQETRALLGEHVLTSVLDAPWVSPIGEHASHAKDQRFFEALSQLVAYARDEAVRLSRESGLASLQKSVRAQTPRAGILGQTQAMLGRYRASVIAEAVAATHRGDAS